MTALTPSSDPNIELPNTSPVVAEIDRDSGSGPRKLSSEYDTKKGRTRLKGSR